MMRLSSASRRPGANCGAPAPSLPPACLSLQLGAELFQQKLGKQCMLWLQDPVYSIREAAINVLQAVAKEFGPDWAREHVVPQVRLGGWVGVGGSGGAS